MQESEANERRIAREKPRTPVLTIAAFALLALIPVMLIAGDVHVTAERITIDLPILHLRGEGAPDINIAR